MLQKNNTVLPEPQIADFKQNITYKSPMTTPLSFPIHKRLVIYIVAQNSAYLFEVNMKNTGVLETNSIFYPVHCIIL